MHEMQKTPLPRSCFLCVRKTDAVFKPEGYSPDSNEAKKFMEASSEKGKKG